MHRTLLIAALVFASLSHHVNVTAAQTAPSDSRAHLLRAAKEGGEVAIDEYLWLLDHGSETDQVFHGVRPSMLVANRLHVLGQRYPQAREALRQRRDALEKAVLACTATRGQAVDFAAINAAAFEASRTLAAYDALAAKGEAAVALRGALIPWVAESLAHARRYPEILAGAADPVAAVDADIAKFTARVEAHRSTQTPEDLKGDVGELVRALHDQVVLQAAGYHEALLATGREAEARKIADRLTGFALDRFTYHMLITGAARAGKPETARAYAEEGLRKLPQSTHADIRESAAAANVTLPPK